MSISTLLSRSSFVAALLLSTIVAAIAATPAHQSVSAYVSGYTGHADAYSIWHAGKSIAPAPFLPLSAGDRITAKKGSDFKLSVEWALTLSVDGKSYRVDAADSPFCIGPKVSPCVANADVSSGPASAAFSVLRNIFASIAPIFSAAHESNYTVATEQITARGLDATAPQPSPPSIPMLANSPTELVPTATGPISFAWLDGAPPYEAWLKDGTNVIYHGANIKDSGKLTIPVHLTTGDVYHLHIQDSQGMSADGSFTATDRGPDLGDSLDILKASGQIPADAISEIHASLLMHAGPQWYFTAYQVVNGTSDPQDLRSFLVRGGKT